MSWKSFVLNFIWFLICIFWIDILSSQDKEWFIDGKGINNICDVMTFIENDDIRPVGGVLTFPLIIPYVYAVLWKKQRTLWQYFVTAAVVLFWSWRFFIRYQLCLW